MSSNKKKDIAKIVYNKQEDESFEILPPQPTNVRNACYNRIPDFFVFNPGQKAGQ